jgi:LPXTG-site transpeptidase (sortase) family protein
MDTPRLPEESYKDDKGFVLPPKQPPLQPAAGSDDAAAVIRQKLQQIYADEPNAKEELEEAESARPRSKHQQFMHGLSKSGKDLATIQTEWHNYYISLPDNEKHEVWQEFYASNAAASQYGQFIQAPAEAQQPAQKLAAQKHEVAAPKKVKAHRRKSDERSSSDIRETIKDKVSAGGKLSGKHHLQSLLFGLGVGLVAVVIFLFGFFNELILAPFIQPSRHASSTPLIIDPNSVAPTKNPEVIIPKINVEIPVDYTQSSTEEKIIEGALNSGIVHYPTTSQPGENGNAAFFGHSSNNIFNPGKYKFAFVLLHEVMPGDTFYLTKDGKVYVYKVFSKTVVDPSEVGVLDPVEGHTATATLITCDPPGTSLKRLVVVGDQISPNPSGNAASTASTTNNSDNVDALPADGPTLWGRWWGTGYGKTVTVLTVLVLVGWGAAAVGKRRLTPTGQPA